MKIETNRSFIRMVGWRNIVDSVKGFLVKHLKTTYLEVVQTRAFHTLKQGLKIWMSLIKEGDIITKGLTWLMLNLWCIGTVALPVADFMAHLFGGRAYTYPLSGAVFYISIASLVLLGLVAVRTYIEYRRYYRSSSHFS